MSVIGVVKYDIIQGRFKKNGDFMQYLPLDKSEILRYLGYRRKQALTDEVSELVDQMMLEVQEIANARYLYQVYDFTLDAEKSAIHVTGTDLVLTSTHLYQQLKQATKIVLLAVTLGVEVDRQIRLYQSSELTKGLVLDAACAAYIEKVCDLAEVELAAEFSNYELNRRFSPGYGDLSLMVQPQFLTTLAADRQLGISLTETYLMIPRKSVTAIIGLFDADTIVRPRRRLSDGLTLEMAEKAKFNQRRT
ncbi:MAG: methionine synthase [Streptococcaceae bacterium]|nr:methionine synthase [Streptococcaceae bacterium]